MTSTRGQPRVSQNVSGSGDVRGANFNHDGPGKARAVVKCFLGSRVRWLGGLAQRDHVGTLPEALSARSSIWRARSVETPSLRPA